ncbi:ATP-dependent helicase [Candidatus Gracilibacteria bacterium]|nr:ATP-dependent helicase [Candidatus Gracilibacteria bacterium]
MNIEEYIASQLNEEQTKAALYIDTPSLIIAGAGSGKTRVLTYKIANLIWGHNIRVNRILAVTFTNKAANEMRERLIKISDEISEKNIDGNKIEKNLDSSPVTQNDKGNDLDNFLNAMNQSQTVATKKSLKSINDLKRIGTFHSIFLKILKEDIDKLGMKYNKNFSIADTNESQQLIRDILKRLNLQEIFKVNEVKGFISNQKNNGNDAKLFLKNINSDYDQSMGKVFEEYQKELEKSNVLDFDDLLLLPYLLFRKNEEVLNKWENKFDYILVDEAQDTNWIQFELMKMMSGKGGNITMIGDDFQSIYGRRGALMENFLNVKKYWPDIVMFKLQINYRSRPNIVHAGNHIIKNNINQYKKEIVPNREGGDKITILIHGSETDEAANIVDMIKKIKDGGKLKGWSNVAILYRTNAQSGIFEQLFIQEGVPYKVYGAFKFFERKEIKDVLAYLKYVLNPSDNLSLKRILNIPNRKIGKTTLDKIEDYAIINGLGLSDILEKISKDQIDLKVTPQAKNGIQDFINLILELTKILEGSRPSEFIETCVKKIKYRDYLIKEEGGETQADEKYENIGQIINMAEKYVEKGEDTLRQFMEEVSLLSDVSETESGDLDAVKLMTIHSSKGLEFPMVFVTGLEDNIFPLANSMMESHLLEEERRLMYVAVTRAKDVLFLSHANSRMTRGQTKMNPPSRFLDEIPMELLKKYDLSSGGSSEKTYDVDEGNIVKHKLFGTGYVLEIWKGLAIVKFHNPKFGVRKIECRFLEVIE